jgi:hypothetical protein
MRLFLIGILGGLLFLVVIPFGIAAIVTWTIGMERKINQKFNLLQGELRKGKNAGQQ